MKSIFTLTFLALACLSVNAQAVEKLAGNEILAVQKGGVADKVYAENYPQLKIATYNIGKNEASDNVADFTSLNLAIKNIGADIIAVPEVDNKTARSQKIDQLKTIADANGYHYAFGKALEFDGGEYGVGILSKYKIEHTQVIKLPSGDAEQRIALLAQIAVPGFDSPVLVMVTHLDWQKDPTMRIEQVRHLLDVSIGDAPSDFKDIASSIKILAGDFNSTHDEQPLKEVGYFFNPVAKQGTDYRTWPAVNPAIDIDHIFTFKGQKWNVKKIEVPHNSPAFNWSSASDHLPLIAELELTEQ
ncbi:endonuclease/exonuclease/phosphatase family protein [Raoultella ornithinolytica]|jgi:endonuclease/exonuclease/phosphatase family metal-dependent hydrolase|uniref:endonuclease/exonuclease/phosphatase family protein n=1 Tax=Raoultella ornithinolytica TaxID=54291 RepID=UPI00081A73F0|nr:endonuclease/exonuclease/phosphatase family protein [Raoultella ornithinolytica]ANZ03858.1 endonuclease [Raoultella ornithinolytica]EJG2383014.1 endonuclease/exonuclease/phosphatase family protein [Raoultella ornithinolytica]EKV6726692.1 endonuclease/exonuclease/phosphatase family protein [Raoultella ornithinolytica]ELS1888281.1 endonuclease/exonuclease/phosphatase family protein [Raoultella ornithinolytica]ELT0600066.1 endonuclease/exonuclease/phosphatase family protein [Raoultella ornithi